MREKRLRAKREGNADDMASLKNYDGTYDVVSRVSWKKLSGDVGRIPR